MVLKSRVILNLQCLILTILCNNAVSKEYYLAFFEDVRDTTASLVLLTTESQPVSYVVEAPGIEDYHNGTLIADDVAVVNLNDSIVVSSHAEQDKGIYLTAESDQITVVGQTISATFPSGDTFLALPITNFCAVQYVYYGISVQRTTGHSIPFTSVVLIVGTISDTTMKLIVPYSVNISVGNSTTELTPGKEYSFVINSLQTVLIESVEDLTGTKITTDNEVSVFSGHQAGSVPFHLSNFDHLVEQIPSVMFWGNVHYVAPFNTRTSYTIKILAAYNFTNVIINCNDTIEYHIVHERSFVTRIIISDQNYCAVHSNNSVLVAQYSHGQNEDFNGDSMMTLVPATVQYLNKLDFSTIRSSSNYNSFVNIIVMAEYYQPSMMYLRTGGMNTSLESQDWVPIVVNNITEAYAAQVNVEGATHIIHLNSTALLTAVVYGFTPSRGYGHPGGLNRNRLYSVQNTVDSVSTINGDTVTLECQPIISCPDVYRTWTYMTVDGSGNLTSLEEVNQSRFQSRSPSLHQLILPTITVNDAGNYTCIVQSSFDDAVLFNHTISLMVTPVCGREFDSLSYGVLWPSIKGNEVARVFCSDITPSFGFGPYATRRCRENGTWERVDTSQCTIRPTQQHYVIVLYSTYTNKTSSPEIEQLQNLFAGSPSVSTNLQYLPTHLMLTPVVFTVTILNDKLTSVDVVKQKILNISSLSTVREITEFIAVDVCLCGSTSAQHSSVVNICVGPSISPCVCNDSGCRCNEEGYTGNGTLCARDSDHDTFPDIGLNCSLPTCSIDESPFIATNNSQDQPPTGHISMDRACPAENDTNYEISWPLVVANMTATVPCTNAAGTATRLCDISGNWETPVLANCSSYEYRFLMELVEQISAANDSNTTTSTLAELTSNLAMITNRTEDGTSEYPTDLMDAVSILEFSITTIEENPEITSMEEIVQNIADSLSNILSIENNAGWMELQEISPMQSQLLLINSERFGLLLAENMNEVGMSLTIQTDNILIAAEIVNTTITEPITFNGTNERNSISIPADFIWERFSATGISPVPVVNIEYRNVENILPVDHNESLIIQPVSQVLSSQVTDLSDTSSNYAVQLTFQYSIDNLNGVSAIRCGYWNYSLNNGSGGWDTEGVTVVTIDMDNTVITCNSTHLTSFAVLVDVSGGHEDIPETERTALSIVSYIGCSISIVCLLTAMVILILYRKLLMEEIIVFVHFNLMIALFIALLIFVCGIEIATRNEIACRVVASLLHYFFTAVFTWMLCEGIFIYFRLVKILSFGLGEKKLFYAALGWGAPLIIVPIAAGISHDQYGNENFCWIETDRGAIWGFVAPVLFVISVNFIFLMLSLRSIYRSKRNITAENTSIISVAKSLLKATIILLPIMGFTWGFGLLAVNQESSAFAWIFAILNSLQGALILIFHILRREKIWKKITACWRSRRKDGINIFSPSPPTSPPYSMHSSAFSMTHSNTNKETQKAGVWTDPFETVMTNKSAVTLTEYTANSIVITDSGISADSSSMK